MANSITLFGEKFWISPYFFTCWLTLKEKGIPFDVMEVSLGAGEQKEAGFAAKSVTARVPALEHDGFSLAESSAIVEYLEEEFPAPAHARVLPEDRRERARARQLMAWVRSDLMALREERPTTTIFYEKATKPLTPAGRAAADKLVRVASDLLVAERPTLFSAWSIVDAELALMLQRLVRSGDDVPAKVRAYAEAQWKRPSVAEFVSRARAPFVPYS